MTSPGREAFERELKRDDWDLLRPDTRRSWEARAAGDMAYIPPTRSAKVNEAEAEQRLPIPPPSIPRRTAEASEITRGPTTIANLARKNGWEVWITYSRGPWLQADGTPALNEDGTVASVETIAVRCKRGGQHATGLWVRKEWLKDPGFVFEGGRAKPAVGTTYHHDSDGLKAILRSEE